jgi:hypothetical protein
LKFQEAVVSLFVIALVFFTSVPSVDAQSNGLSLEAEQNWDTYGVGGTCVYGTQNIFVGDVDGDGVSEILTGGFAYHTQNNTRTISEAPLKVWTWNGQNVTLKASTTWYGTIVCVYAADVDKDGKIDILCGGSFRNETGNSTSSLRVLTLSDEKLSLKTHYEGIPATSIFVSDVDKDGINDVLTVGRYISGLSQLSLWHFQEGNLLLVQRSPLAAANVTSASSVYASDLDNDGTMEIMVGGYSDSLSNSKGLASIWRWNGQVLSLEAAKTWQLAGGTAKTIAGGNQGNTAVNNVKAADLDGDGKEEMVTAGFAYDGDKVNAQIKIWRWDGNSLTELASEEWATDYLTEAKSIALNDVNGDGKVEIVQSGIAAAEDSFKNPEGIHDRGQLRVWAYNGIGLSLMESEEWTFDEGSCAWNVGNGDVDNDGVVEMITVGCTALNSLCDPDMRIWSLPAGTSDYPSYLLYAVGGALVVACASSLVYLNFRRTKSEDSPPNRLCFRT